MKKKLLLVLSIVFLVQTELFFALSQDTIKKETTKSGWSFGAVPVIAYDSDIGFKYGGLVNFYHYGDGTIYPMYKHSIYLEWSRTTKGSGINQITYDSKYLIPKVRVSGEASYLTEQGLDFYGFNGYQALYNHDFENDELADTIYKSRMYYRQDRKMLRLRADFQGRFLTDNVKWVAGFVRYDIKLDTLDIEKLNKGQSSADKLPAVGGGLYGNYIDWNVIPDKETHGSSNNIVKLGIAYDTRDNEPNPMKGVWSEALLLWSPGFLGNKDYSFARLSLTHRQYFTLVDDQLSFVYRVGYQAKIAGKTPSYLLPFIYYSGLAVDRDGLGGAKTVRGILRNRIVGEDMAYGNLEMRWKFLRTIILKQNVYLAFSTFFDMGMVTRDYKIDISQVPDEYLFLFPDKKESLHKSTGAGLRIALNQNFIVAADYGVALDKNDGKTGLYIAMNWLF